MENLHVFAKDGTLDRAKIQKYLIRQPIDDEDDYGETPLQLAIKGGHVSAVKLLLQNGADANLKAPDGRSPLYLAAQAPANNARIAELLLNHKARVDDRVSQLGNDTPIMEAIRRGTSPELIKLLVEHGASLKNPNLKGETGRSLADKSTNTAVHKALRPKDETPTWKPELENLLVSSGLFALAYFNNFKDVGVNAFNRLAALNADSQTAKEDYPQTEEEFKKAIEGFVSRNGLEDFYPQNNEYVKGVSEKAAELLREGPSTADESKKILIMSHLALYQPILYADDSGSMQDTDGKDDTRMVRQALIVERIAEQTNDGGGNDLHPDDLPPRMNFTPSGSTKLGTNLKGKILDEFLYKKLDAGEDLEKPLLILTVTDGAPNEEDKDEFRKQIEASFTYVASKGYGPDALKYSLNQIGNAPEATDFLSSWEGNPLLATEQVRVNTEQLDARFDEFYNNDDFDGWLLKVLNPDDKVQY
ncbi:hypothetical protein N7468_008489 [Penicillium chermesinum]|uniref:Ankyrin repeat protein n=1 Tax=Penicillium chermesinum TaxID=63820 RepID=A0A9W9NPT7_9EURO|nr:uncharacterized protein N7468_008489 [Penicillium chermesinum]KAJ5223947.1 hypothetical protein N7468_008489 [Penicillium chermesinum]